MMIQTFYVKNTGLNLKCGYLLLFSQINVRENGKAMKNGQSRDTGIARHKTQIEDKQNTIHRTKTNKVQCKRWGTYIKVNWNSKANKNKCKVKDENEMGLFL